MTRGATNRLLWGLALAAVLFGLYRAIDSLWVCDDAFISFRYAQNLVEGHGLVYNAEERVEGYTNFSWTMVVAGGTSLGFEAVAFAQWLGILLFVATLGLLMLRSRSAGALPVAATGLALHRHFQEFASCGLETALFTFLALALVLRAASAARASHWAQAGLLGVLLAMTRPDGALFCAVAGIAAVAVCVRERRWSPLLGYAAPFLLVYLPYFAWKWSYYGHPLPNTFYAKSAADPYAGQGLYYVLLFFQTYWILVPALLAIPVLCWRRPRSRLTALIAGSCAAYLAFVVWVGGDFMFARFLIPITPLLYLALELVGDAPGTRLRSLLPVVVAAGTLLAWQHPELQAGPGPEHLLRGIGDERVQYPPQRVAAIRSVGRSMGEVVPDARVVFFGTQAMLVYEAGFAYALEGSTGLTDEHLARLPLPERGHVGHEKGIDRDPVYVLQRGVQFLLAAHPGLLEAEPYRAISFFGMPSTVAIYDREMMRRLRGVDGVELVDFERLLDEYIRDLPKKPPAQVRRDLARFRVYYFDHNEDPERLAALERAAR